jgi:Domain of unknown function (DUF4136)
MKEIEMKFRKLLAVSLFLMALTSAVFADHVSVDYDHRANFNGASTYSWSKVQTANSIWDQRVKDAVNQQLAAKGWTEVPSGGAVSLVAVEKTSIHQQYDTFYDGFGGGRFGRFGGFGGFGDIGDATTSIDNYKVGTLVVSMFDGNSKQLIWRGTSGGDLSRNPEKNTKNLDKDVAKMFKKFPPRTA